MISQSTALLCLNMVQSKPRYIMVFLVSLLCIDSRVSLKSALLLELYGVEFTFRCFALVIICTSSRNSSPGVYNVFVLFFVGGRVFFCNLYRYS